MATPELLAFWELEQKGLIMEGEFYSPSQASQNHYTDLLKEFNSHAKFQPRQAQQS